MQIVVAQREDILGWLVLAAEVEPLFGPLIDDTGFQQSLAVSIQWGVAFCIREGNASAGAPLVGGLLLSARPPHYAINWLAVAERHRRCGAARGLVRHVMGLMRTPAELVVTTFAPGSEGSGPARRLYESMGFQPAEMAPGPRGEMCQVYRCLLPAR